MSSELSPLDLFSKLDIRVGKVLSAQNHPNSDMMYVEQIDVGEETPRTIVSGIRGIIPLKNFIGQHVPVVCNLKPAKLRGIVSSGMILCAHNENSGFTKLLTPNDKDVKPGERIVIEGVPVDSEPATGNVMKKKKIWERCTQYMVSCDDHIAGYNGLPLTTRNNGNVRFECSFLKDFTIG